MPAIDWDKQQAELCVQLRRSLPSNVPPSPVAVTSPAQNTYQVHPSFRPLDHPESLSLVLSKLPAESAKTAFGPEVTIGSWAVHDGSPVDLDEGYRALWLQWNSRSSIFGSLASS